MDSTHNPAPAPARLPASSEEKAEQDEAKSSATHASELEHLCECYMHVINTRDWTYSSAPGQTLLAHVSPTWESRFDNVPYSMSFAEQNATLQRQAREYPDFQLAISHVDCTVDGKERTATVLLQSTITGYGNVTLHGACELKWKFTEGRWMWWYYRTLRGM